MVEKYLEVVVFERDYGRGRMIYRERDGEICYDLWEVRSGELGS